MKNKKLLWFFVALILSALTIFTIFKSSGLSFQDFVYNIKNASLIWLLAAIACTVLFIFFEGESIVQILKGLGLKAKHRRGFLYSAADIYFSSITPSASGGQPASAFFMLKDGFSAPAVTVSLILNVTMYTISIIVLGISTLIFFPFYFKDFPLLGEIVIIFGIVMLAFLVTGFVLILKHQSIIMRLGNFAIKILNKIHLKKEAERLQNKLESLVANYNQCIRVIAGKKKILIKVFFLNFLQRISQILITVFSYFALHGDISKGLNVFAIQAYVVLGSNFIPVPGAIGISEYLMLCGYMLLMNEESAYNLAILSRGISFYTCITISIITVLFGYIMTRYKARLNSK